MDERLARMEEKMSLMHEDVKVLKNAHLEAIEFKGSIKGIKWLLGITWAAIISVAGVIIGVYTRM